MMYLSSSAEMKGYGPCAWGVQEIEFGNRVARVVILCLKQGEIRPLQDVKSEHFELSPGSGLKDRKSMDGGGHDMASKRPLGWKTRLRERWICQCKTWQLRSHPRDFLFLDASYITAVGRCSRCPALWGAGHTILKLRPQPSV